MKSRQEHQKAIKAAITQWYFDEADVVGPEDAISIIKIEIANILDRTIPNMRIGNQVANARDAISAAWDRYQETGMNIRAKQELSKEIAIAANLITNRPREYSIAMATSAALTNSVRNEQTTLKPDNIFNDEFPNKMESLLKVLE